MTNRPKQVGTDAENKVVAYARERGWTHADRLTLSGAQDRGDVRLGDGIPVTIEVKGGQGALRSPHSHLKELRTEMSNNSHTVGAVIAKKPGSAKVGPEWVAMMPVEVFFDILDTIYKSDVGSTP